MPTIQTHVSPLTISSSFSQSGSPSNLSSHFSVTSEMKNVPSLNRLMADLQFYIFFNNISVISGQCVGDNKRLCAMAPHL